MRATHASTEEHHEPELYELRLKGHLDKRWADWFPRLDHHDSRPRRDVVNRPGGRSGRLAWRAEESA